MPPKHRRSVALATALISIVFALLCKPAAASFVYNYDAAWMFDTSSGLYWQYEQIPSATFTPATGRVATFSELDSLGPQIGMTNGLLRTGMVSNPVPNSYDMNLANLLSFFDFDAPADVAPLQPGMHLRGLLDLSPNAFEYATLDYAPPGSQRFFWTYNTGLTVGGYHPGFCYNGDPCGLTQSAFVVSTTPPVPIPAAVWLMLSGLTVFGLRRKLT